MVSLTRMILLCLAVLNTGSSSRREEPSLVKKGRAYSLNRILRRRHGVAYRRSPDVPMGKRPDGRISWGVYSDVEPCLPPLPHALSFCGHYLAHNNVVSAFLFDFVCVFTFNLAYPMNVTLPVCEQV